MSQSFKPVLLSLAYDGTDYCGFQNNRRDPSIANELEIACEKVLKFRPQFRCVSRTDRGVHAKDQVAFAKVPLIIPIEKLEYSLRCLLPKAIVLKKLSLCPLDDVFPLVEKKHYRYSIYGGPVQPPQYRFTSWHLKKSLEKDALYACAADLLQLRDFSQYCGEKVKDPLCTLHSLDLTFEDAFLYIDLCADRFLYKMARHLVGALIILQKRRFCAPAHGLCLEKVFLKPLQSLL